MKITDILVRNFLGIREADIVLDKPVALFGGANGAGKSSMEEAVRLALTGDATRVERKKEYDALLNVGATGGQITVAAGDAHNTITLPAGKLTRGLPDDPRMPLVLDAQRFARLVPADRRAFLYDLLGVKIGHDEMRQRLVSRLGYDAALPAAAAARLKTITPLLRAGFDAAQKDAVDRTKAARAAWKAVTGETYGCQKAATWRPERVEFDEAVTIKLESELESVDGEIGDVRELIGAAEASRTAANTRASKIAELRAVASQHAKRTDSFNYADAQVKEFQPKVDALRASAGAAPAGVECTCPECGALLRYLHGVLSAVGASNAIDEEARDKLPEYEASLAMLERAAANRRADLDAAEAAAAQLTLLEAEAADFVSSTEIDEMRARLAALTEQRGKIAADVNAARERQRRATAAADVEMKAQAHHADVTEWDRIAEALGPDGIPADLLNEAIGPMNEKLAGLAEMSEWDHVLVKADMSIFAGGRPYGLLSESERWRADAHIAAAITLLSGLRLLVLDRADLLIAEERDRLLYWLDDLAFTNQIDTALVFMSLKAPPKALPESIEAFWIENSRVTPVRADASAAA
ncbi:DNA repair protein [Burkholderia sp. MSMB0856]|uniref:AAA family ATPase n=1 Tax=Burkholderia sp. MSMB0856 TaxID=1637869 RepID=UPI0007580577|nr:AAA family ATPase [Burkholderia sp. MSMB0856]AOJ86696.1 DNA repair protein [Burkholderia sp. MSMB0856]KVH38037.1 DNA repair protein [Burkholderia sp. MSMB0856]